MKIVLFCHSLVSDWNHGNAHFLRGIAAEMIERGIDLHIYEPRGAWSLENLKKDYGKEALDAFHRAFPKLRSLQYDPQSIDLNEALNCADLVIVHEWSSPQLVAKIGRHRIAGGRYKLLFHDTHHRSVSAPHEMRQFELSGFDGVLAFGESVKRQYEQQGWAHRVWVWHEAADTRVFHPRPHRELDGDIVWIGNWGDGERTKELEEYLLAPIREMRLRASVYGVRYPEEALMALESSGIEYRGWTPNYAVPEIFSKYRATIHVPRRYYATMLPGIPTIRVFEALACGIPLISAPWDDSEQLFRPGRDYLIARSRVEMTSLLMDVLMDTKFARTLIDSGLETIRARHTCAHRVDELMSIANELGISQQQQSAIEVAH